MFAVLLQPYVVGYMYAQHIESSVIRVRTLPISFQLTDNEQLFPKRNPPIVSEDDVTGVYNDTTQTMTLTYHFTSDSTVVSIYRDFNKMLQDTISVTNGTEINYLLSNYGQGDFVFDIRRPRNDSIMVSVGSFNNIEMVQAGIGEALYFPYAEEYTMNPYNSPRTIQEYYGTDGIQYSYNASLGNQLRKTFCEKIVFDHWTTTVQVKCDSVDCDFYMFDPLRLPMGSIGRRISKNASDYTDIQHVVRKGNTYILMAVAAENSEGGRISVKVEGQEFLNRPVYYNYFNFSMPADTSKVRNIFATNSTDPLQLFVLRNHSANSPGTVRYYSEGYGNTSTYNWGRKPRICEKFDYPVTGIIVNDLSDSPTFIRDRYTNLYVGCEGNTTGLNNIFRNDTTVLKNIMVSGKKNDGYRSWHWAVGEWSVRDVAESQFTAVEDSLGYMPLDATERLLATKGFVRTSTGGNDAAIDVYGRLRNNVMRVTNVAVRTYKTPEALGYEWESKMGYDERVFHPRNGLGSRYQLIASFRPKTLSEIARDNSYEEIMKDYVYENAQLTNSEANELINRTLPVSYDDLDDFDYYYYSSKQALSNSPDCDFGELDSCSYYNSLLSLCQSEPLLLYEAFLHVDDGDDIAIKLVEDLMDVRHHPAMQTVREYILANKYVGTGANMHKVRRTMHTNAVLFIKAFLSMSNNQQQAPRQGITYSNDEDAFVARANGGSIDVEFSLPKDATVSLCVATPDGSMIDQQIGSQRMEQGDYSRRVGVGKSGVYVVSYVVNGRIYNKKVIVK